MNKEAPVEAIELANKIVNDYTSEQFKAAYAVVQKEQHGEGCGCPSCVKHAVSEVNSWTEWVAGGTCDIEPYLYHVGAHGTIYMGDRGK